jgi:hypothetical protein
MSASSLGDPQSLNLYAYCGNDPINHTDPDGLFFKKLFKWVGKISGILKWIGIAITIAVGLLVTFGATGAALKILLFLNKHQWIGKLLNVGNKLGSFRTPGIFGGGSPSGVSSFISGDDLEDGGPPIVIATWVPGPWWDKIKGGAGAAWDWATTDGINTVANFSAGMGDDLSFGATSWGRRKLDVDDGVNLCSGAYSAGGWAGVGVGLAGGIAKSGIRGVIGMGRGRE